MKTIQDIIAAVSVVDELIERAKMILSDAPYFTYIPEEKYVRLSVDGEIAKLVWPESHSGYYDSCSIEEQSKEFPAELLLMERAEIELWGTEQKRIYDENARINREHQEKVRAERQRREELRILAELQEKYGIQ